MSTLSSILVQRGAASMRAVEEAIARQVLHGGDLPTNLLELGAVGEDALVQILAESFGLEPAPPRKLLAPSPAVLALIPPELAKRQSIFPIAQPGRQLVVAVAEPLSPTVLGYLGETLELEVVQRVALLVYVRQAMAEHYAINLERRFERLLTRLDGLRATEVAAAPPPKAAAPPPAVEGYPLRPPQTISVPAPSFGTGLSNRPPALHDAASKRESRGRLEDVPPKKTPFQAALAAQALPVIAEDVIDEHVFSAPAKTASPSQPPRAPSQPPRAPSQPPRAPSQPLPSRTPTLPQQSQVRQPPPPSELPPVPSLRVPPVQAPPQATQENAKARAGQETGPRAPDGTQALAGWVRLEMKNERTAALLDKTRAELRPALRAARRKGPFTAVMAEAELEAAASTDAVLDVVFAFAAQFFEYTAIFAIQGDLAEGRDAAGPGAGRERVAALGVPLDLPSSLERLRRHRAPIVGPLAAEGLDADLLRDLARDTARPGRSVALLPVLIRTRPVAILFGDDGEADVSLPGLGDLLAFIALAARALERILVRKKLGARAPEMPLRSPSSAPPPRGPARPDDARLRALVEPQGLIQTSPTAESLAPPAPVSGAGEPHKATAGASESPPAASEPPGASEAVAGASEPVAGARESSAGASGPAAARAEEPEKSTLGTDSTPPASLARSSAREDESGAASPAELLDSGRETIEWRHGAPSPVSIADLPDDDLELFGDRPDRTTWTGIAPSSSPDAQPPARPGYRGVRVTGSTEAPPSPRDRRSSFPGGEGRISPVPESPARRASSNSSSAWNTYPAPPAPAAVQRRPPISDRPIPREEADSAPGVAFLEALDPTPGVPVPSLIVDVGAEHAALLQRVIDGGPAGQEAVAELARHGDQVLQALMAKFPGPLRVDRHRARETLPAASQCGPILEVLVAIRRPALPFVSGRASSLDPEVRFWATHVLGELRYPEAATVLIPRLFDEDAGVRRVARRSASSLVAAGAPGEPILRGLENLTRNADHPAAHRILAIETMAEIRSAALVPPLLAVLAALEGRADDVAEAARRALVIITRQDFNRDVRRWQDWWSRSSSHHRIEWLIDALMHDHPAIRRSAGDELKAVTKEYFGYYDDLPKKERERAQGLYRTWWEEHGKQRFV